jgi:hypothetical protein
MTPAEAMAAAGDEGNTVPARTVLHVDGDGSRLTADRWHSGSGITLSIDNGSLLDVDALEIPEITTAMYRACGHKPPVMLGRPDLDAMRGPDGSVRFGNLALYRTADGDIGFAVRLPGEAHGVCALLPPAQARQAAAVAVALADEKPEPDPAEVDALARTLREASLFPEPLTPLYPDLRDLARKILLAGWKRETDRG